MDTYRSVDDFYKVVSFRCPYKMNEINKDGNVIREGIHWNEYFEEKLNDLVFEGYRLVSHSVNSNCLVINPLDKKYPDNEYYGVVISCVVQKIE